MEKIGSIRRTWRETMLGAQLEMHAIFKKETQAGGRDTHEGLQPAKVPHQGSNTGKPRGTLIRKKRAAE